MLFRDLLCVTDYSVSDDKEKTVCYEISIWFLFNYHLIPKVGLKNVFCYVMIKLL